MSESSFKIIVFRDKTFLKIKKDTSTTRLILLKGAFISEELKYLYIDYNIDNIDNSDFRIE